PHTTAAVSLPIPSTLPLPHTPSSFLYQPPPPPPPPSSPTRRSPDLSSRLTSKTTPLASAFSRAATPDSASMSLASTDLDALSGRSEEHTSELQSLTNLVCRLLL